jgi:hypothetical protein
VRTVRTRSAEGIATGTVYPYARAHDRDLALVARQAGGVFVCGPAAAHEAAGLAALGVEAIADPAMYEKSDTPMFSGREWVRSMSRSSQTLLLTPSPYVGRNELSTLTRVIEEAAAARAADTRVVAVLALASSWLRDSEVDRLIYALRGLEAPVGLVLANSHNPIGGKDSVKGLVRFINANPELLLLRTDNAGLGAIAHGARAAGIGIRSSIRHLYRSKGGGARQDLGPSAFAIPLCDFHYAARFALTRGTDADGFLDCPCPVCDGKSLQRLDAPGSDSEANNHSVAAWLHVARDINGTPSDLRILRWQQICDDALVAHRQLSRSTGVAFQSNSPLAAWAAYPSRRPALS